MMRRRRVLAVLGAWPFAACGPRISESVTMPSGPPQKIRLIPDQWHIRYVGRLGDGRLFFVTPQLASDGRVTTDFVCSFFFDSDGAIVAHSIELIGKRGDYADGAIAAALERQLAVLGHRTETDIWVRPFAVDHQGIEFGLIPRDAGGGDWRVEFMPGNTLSFYAPWELGEYDS